MSFYDGPRDPTAPFFMAKDRRRPYTYAAACTDLKMMLRRVSPEDTEFGLHGLRVQGYNDAKDGDDAEMAGAHGGWQPGSHSRYARFRLERVFALSTRMVEQSAGPLERALVGSDDDDEDDVSGAHEDEGDDGGIGGAQRGDVSAALEEEPNVPQGEAVPIAAGAPAAVLPLAHFMSMGRVLRSHTASAAP